MNPIQDPTKLVQLDGQLLDAEQPALLASLPGVLRGEGIFETFVIRDGVPTPLLAQHDKRLAHSAKLTGFDLQLGSLQQSFKNFQPLVKVGNWRVRLTVLRGLNGQQHFQRHLRCLC